MSLGQFNSLIKFLSNTSQSSPIFPFLFLCYQNYFHWGEFISFKKNLINICFFYQTLSTITSKIFCHSESSQRLLFLSRLIFLGQKLQNLNFVKQRLFPIILKAISNFITCSFRYPQLYSI